ncbi:MAG: HlyD family type I secretion periplasmic adaptor subunit [Thioalkalispiraceae bacterium]|jgi:adhesin transport system membrane fusion protein
MASDRKQQDINRDNAEQRNRFATEADEAVEYYSPAGGRKLLWVIVLFFVAISVWASLAEVDQITRAKGKVIPAGHVQVIQNLEGGIVDKIMFKEGDIVDAGDILLRLDDTQFASDLAEGRLHCLEHRAQAARLKAEADLKPFEAPAFVLERKPELVEQEQQLYLKRKAQLERKERSLQKELNMLRPLVKTGAVSELEVLRVERQLQDIKDGFCSGAREELNETLVEIERLKETNKALEDRVKRTRVRSPVRGIVKQMLVKTEGGVIKPGVKLAEIVPLDDTLLIEAKVKPSDIGFLHKGQKAMVKFTAYDFSIYGGLEGKIEHIGADTITDSNANREVSYYKILVRTDRNYLGSEQDPLSIIPGMAVNVDIKTGKKTVLQYLLKPVLKAKEKAFTER